jgi:hypothetical protein
MRARTLLALSLPALVAGADRAADATAMRAYPGEPAGACSGEVDTGSPTRTCAKQGACSGEVDTGSPTRTCAKQEASFVEVAWPFAIDQWGTGRAFRCDQAHCGAPIDLYLRAKVGFCNCTTGVADDDEIDRVGDTGLLADAATALADGRPVTAGILRGRARLFRLDRRFAAPRFVLEVALNNKCDAVVATAVAAQPMDEALRRAVLGFLGGADVQHWAAANTGSETQ